LIRAVRLETDHLAVVVVSEHRVRRFEVELLGVRVERYHVVAVAYLVVRPPPVRRQNLGVLGETPVVPGQRIPYLKARILNTTE